MSFTPRYRAQMFHKGCWEVIGPSGIPVYDKAPEGGEKPLVFHNEDELHDFLEQCNAFDETHTVCPGCGNEVDQEVCWCGDLLATRNAWCGHTPVPMGCDCGRCKLPEDLNVDLTTNKPTDL